MKIKGQVTIYIILGIILISSFLFLSYVSKPETPTLNILDTTQIQTFTESCINKIVIEGIINTQSLNSSKLENYANLHVKDCTNNFSIFPELEITEGNIISDISLTTDHHNLIINANYPLDIKQSDVNSKLSDFYVNVKLNNQVKLLDSGITPYEIELNSIDGLATLTIPEGVKILNSNNTPAEYVSISIKDITNYKGDFVSKIIYELEPHGAKLSQPAKLQIKYNKTNIIPHEDPNLDNEDFTTISTFDGGFDPKLAKPYPSTINKTANIVTANITHFSGWTVTSDSYNQNFQWKNYLAEPTNEWGGRYTATRWPTAFYKKYGASRDNTKVIVDGATFTWYALDTDFGSARLSYGESTRTVSTYPEPSKATFYKEGKPFAEVMVQYPKIANAPPYSLIDIHDLTCLSPECGALISCERPMIVINLTANDTCKEASINLEKFKDFKEPYGIQCNGGGRGYLLQSSLGDTWTGNNSISNCTSKFNRSTDKRIIKEISCNSTFYKVNKSDLSGYYLGVFGEDSEIELCSAVSNISNTGSGSSSSSGTCGSPANACEYQNGDINQPCPTGWVNCDCEHGCAFQGTKANCPVEC